MRNDVQVIIYSLSSDEKDPLDILAINAASTAMTISDIPWDGPIGAVRIGRINGEFIINPTYEELMPLISIFAWQEHGKPYPWLNVLQMKYLKM